MEKEIWKNIDNYEGYQVSNKGRIRKIFYPKIQTCYKGYQYVPLYKKNKKKAICVKVHRLVIEAFKGKSLLQVDHINENKQDNRISNLQYLTNRENCIKSLLKNKKNTSSKYIGVSFCMKSGKWTAKTKILGKTRYIGSFKEEENAHKAYEDIIKNGIKEVYKYKNLAKCKKGNY